MRDRLTAEHTLHFLDAATLQHMTSLFPPLRGTLQVVLDDAIPRSGPEVDLCIIKRQSVFVVTLTVHGYHKVQVRALLLTVGMAIAS